MINFYSKNFFGTLFIGLFCTLFSFAQSNLPKSKQAQEILSKTNLELLTRGDFSSFDPVEYAKVNYPKDIMKSNDIKAKNQLLVIKLLRKKRL
jgi:hypothetical protein